MGKPRFRRRKEDRPAEITQAALEAFSERGYDGTRVDDVAKRAGVSKGLLYLYFRTKEELFKAVVRKFIGPRVAMLEQSIRDTELSATDYLRGPFLEFATQLPRSPVRILIRLIVAEGHRHPDLTAYYWDNVIVHGLAAIRSLIERGVRRGEFRDSALDEFPQLLISPVLLAVVWASAFDRYQELDTDRFIRLHIELILDAIQIDDHGGHTS